MIWYSIKKSQRSVEEDFAEGVCCIASRNFVIFAVAYNCAEGLRCILWRNILIFYNRLQEKKCQRRGWADCDIVYFFRYWFVSVHNIVYLHVSLHKFFVFDNKNEVTLFIVVKLKRSFFLFFVRLDHRIHVLRLYRYK